MRKAILIVSAVIWVAGCGILEPSPDHMNGPKDTFSRMERNSP